MWTTKRGMFGSMFHRVRIPPENGKLLHALDPEHLDFACVTGLEPDGGPDRAAEIVWTERSAERRRIAQGLVHAIRRCAAIWRKPYAEGAGGKEFLRCAEFPEPCGMHADAVLRFGAADWTSGLAVFVEMPPAGSTGWQLSGSFGSLSDCGMKECWSVGLDPLDSHFPEFIVRFHDMEKDPPAALAESTVFPGLTPSAVAECIDVWMDVQDALDAMTPQEKADEKASHETSALKLMDCIIRASPAGTEQSFEP